MENNLVRCETDVSQENAQRSLNSMIYDRRQRQEKSDFAPIADVIASIRRNTIFGGGDHKSKENRSGQGADADRAKWLEYEREKETIESSVRSSGEYEARVKRIAEGLSA